MREGEVITATIVAVRERGLDLEAEGVPGFVQPIELSWCPVQPLDETASPGQRVEVLVYAITPERFYASIKRAHPELDPWREPERFAVGTLHHATVATIVDWGAKVTLDEGVSGMILCADVGSRHHVGQELDVVVTTSDPTLRRIELAPRA